MFTEIFYTNIGAGADAGGDLGGRFVDQFWNSYIVQGVIIGQLGFVLAIVGLLFFLGWLALRGK